MSYIASPLCWLWITTSIAEVSIRTRVVCVHRLSGRPQRYEGSCVLLFAETSVL